jgi:hypothetical protein
MKTSHLFAAFLLMIAAVALFVYIDPKITGLPVLSTRVVILTTQGSNCNMTFFQGWNLVSFACIPGSQEMDFFNITYESIRSYDASDASDPWKSYNPSLPSYVVHDLTSLSRAKGYWVQVPNTTVFFKNSTLVKPTFIALKRGWNLLGLPNQTISDTYNTFETLIPGLDYIYIYNASDSDWKEWTWNTSLPSDQDLNRSPYGYGYWIYMLNETTFTIQ